MRIDVLTLFSEAFANILDISIVRRAREKGLLEVVLSNIRDFALDNYNSVDDKPYGGGPGMVMMCQPILDCLEQVEADEPRKGRRIMLSPQGQPFSQGLARELAEEERLILIAGRYEGFDERIRIALQPLEISIGDYVLSGGEIPAMVIIDAVTRLLPGALGDERSVEQESFTAGLLEYPQYTRPEVFRDLGVPEVLLSGHHAKIEEWRNRQAQQRTRQRRPDLLAEPANETQEQKNDVQNNRKS
jgi:tRNA (guanine37-N1)-methyltransferase